MYVCNMICERKLNSTFFVNQCFDIPYSAYISRLFNFVNFTNLESFRKIISAKILALLS